MSTAATAKAKSQYRKLYADDNVQVWENLRDGTIEVGLPGRDWGLVAMNKSGRKNTWAIFEKQTP